MELLKTGIEGVFIVKINIFKDSRGGFQKIFNRDFFEKKRLETDFKEFYFSSSGKNVIRGLHFQLPPREYAKIVYVSRGSIMDVALDLRKSSLTFGKVFSKQLDCVSGEFLYLPKGIAHGFRSLENGTIVNYAQTSCYSKEHDTGILFSSIKYDWGTEAVIVSERDRKFMTFEEFKNKDPF